MLRIKPGFFPQKLFHHFWQNLVHRIISPNDKSIKKYNWVRALNSLSNFCIPPFPPGTILKTPRSSSRHGTNITFLLLTRVQYHKESKVSTKSKNTFVNLPWNITVFWHKWLWQRMKRYAKDFTLKYKIQIMSFKSWYNYQPRYKEAHIPQADIRVVKTKHKVFQIRQIRGIVWKSTVISRDLKLILVAANTLDDCERVESFSAACFTLLISQ